MNGAQRAAALAALGKLEKRVEQLRWREKAAQNLAKAEAAAAAIDTMVAAQRGTGQKYTHVAGVGRYGADPYGVLCDALGLNVVGVWDSFDVRRPQEGIPAKPNPFALGLQNGGR